ncbi:MAG: superoxide dismutase [Methylobacteriaceae bacterium]|nr:superoxide dismutase [Methylobacteriaceae bacterium]
MITRRTSLALALGAGAAGLLAGRGALAQAKPAIALPPLGYPNEALEPHIDTTTMMIHHNRHHAAFVANLNGLVERWPDLATKSPAEIMANPAQIPEAIRQAVRNNLGGHYNHSFFWDLMTPGGAKAPAGDLKAAIDGAFGSLEQLQEKVNAAGLARFGSGWAWLVVNKDKKLDIVSTPNQDTPLETGATPLLGVDVWEHAYYLKYQNRRADYLKSWWNVVNWDKAAAHFARAKG